MIRKLLKRAVLLVGVLAICLGLAAIFFPDQVLPDTVGDVVGSVIDPASVAFGEKQHLYILLLGVDYNYDDKAQRHTKGARSDTILLVRVEPRGRQLSMMSIPRDLLVPIGKDGIHGYDKINAAFAAGGVETTKDTIEQFLELEIDHHIIVKSDVVEGLVDSLGGVKVDVEMDMDYDDNWAGLHIHLKKGEQVLNGSDAIGYLRFRGGWDGDLGRIRRQQQFLEATLRQLKARENWKRYPALAQTVAANMKTDLSAAQLVGLANLYKSFPMSRLRKGRVEVDDHYENGISYLVPLREPTDAAMDYLFPELPPALLAKVDVKIEDYRKRRRSHRKIKNKFRDAGFGKIVLKGIRPKKTGETQITITGENSVVQTQLERMFPGIPIKVVAVPGGKTTVLYELHTPRGTRTKPIS